MIWDESAMFFKIRMRRMLRAVLRDAAPAARATGLPALSVQIRRAEAAALARGLASDGLSPAQAAVLMAHVACAQAGLGAASSIRVQAAVGAFAARRGLSDFERAVAAHLGEVERLAALGRQGYPTHPPVLPIAPVGGARQRNGRGSMPVIVGGSSRIAPATPPFDAGEDTQPGA